MVLALLLTLEEVLRDVRDILRSRKKLYLWQQLAKHRLQSDLSCSHPMWPQVGIRMMWWTGTGSIRCFRCMLCLQEREFLLNQFKLVDRKRGSYCRDLWYWHTHTHTEQKPNVIMCETITLLHFSFTMSQCECMVRAIRKSICITMDIRCADQYHSKKSGHWNPHHQKYNAEKSSSALVSSI